MRTSLADSDLRRPARWPGSLAPCAVDNRSASSQDQPVYFNTDVVPILTKLGCNGGGCHGKADGQNGFKLSLLGFEPDVDYEAIVKEARGRRLFPAVAGASLLLLKATGTVAHGGGKRLDVGSEEYQTIRRWIENGSPPATTFRSRRCDRITVTPERGTFDAENRRQPLQVTAHFSDGTTRDVTRQAVYQSNEPDIAEVNDAGVVQVKNRSGLFAVMVRYGDQIAVFHGTVPHRRRRPASDRRWRPGRRPTAGSGIDRHLVAKWKRLGIVPSRAGQR